ncbi:MAG TPA: hypothetical protein VMD49_11100 [Steroidobacteraceae bacterium]|nr:hypothetical protein [Steroidobacteraceae bacterium]
MYESELGNGGTARPVWISQSWLRAESLAALAEVNEQCLELLCEQASAGGARQRSVLAGELEPLFRGLDAAARRRAASCPFLLLDAGFSAGARRIWPAARCVRDRDWAGEPAPFFTVARTVPVTRLVLAYAWHLVRSEGAAARLFLGMSPACAGRLAVCTLRQVIQLAESDPGLLNPRWPHRRGVWRDLLAAAAAGDECGIEQFRMRGLALLAADARAGELATDSSR